MANITSGNTDLAVCFKCGKILINTWFMSYLESLCNYLEYLNCIVMSFIS